jgi:glycosyltransferase involved in cell wall biosynthesis
MIKLTIVTPSYNQGRFLEETIQSVLSQDYPNLEYIIIDGGSTDNSVDIIKKYKSRLAYWVSEPDQGQSHAINKGLERATGDIIGWINSDDIYTRGSFQKVLTAFNNNPDAILVYSDRIMIDELSQVSGWSCNPDFDPRYGNFNVCSETAFWRRTAAEGMTFDNSLHFAMDLDFFCRLYLRGKFIKLNDYLGAFRCYKENKSATIPEIGQRESSACWEAIFGEPRPRQLANRSKGAQLAAIIRHPRLIAIPYLRRRFRAGKRGID